MCIIIYNKNRTFSLKDSTFTLKVLLFGDEELDIEVFDKLLDYVGENIHDAQNRVKYTMNGFVISTAAYIPALTKKAIKIAEKIGKVHVEMGGTACKVPLATEYIQKMIDTGRAGKKRKMARC